MTANKSFEERLTALITDVYNSHEEPHSSSSVINETVDFIKNIIQQERRAAKKEEQAIREDERRKIVQMLKDRKDMRDLADKRPDLFEEILTTE